MERRTRPARAGTTGPATRVQPNIFFIVLDGYGREDVLRGIYSYDNAPFLSELRRRGFRIMPSSHANYCQTLLSTSATLNAQYLPTLLPNVPETANDRLPLKQLLDQSSVIAFLRKRQYSTVGVSSGYEGTSVDKTDVSIRRETLLSRYHYALLRLTPLSFVISRPKGAPLNRYEEHRKAIRYALYTLGQLKDKRQPLFVFAHILSPHPPFVFKRDGTSRYSVRRYSLADASDFIDEGGTREEYLTQYPEQLHYTNLLVLEVLDQIRTNATRPTVIILQSDHGPGAHFIWRDPDHSNMTERFGILNAIAVPAGDPVPFYDTMSPVNTFRILFNYYFGTSLRTLPDESFFSSTTTPFRFLPVTHRILPHLPSQGAAE
jgi:hypothetical protein